MGTLIAVIVDFPLEVKENMDPKNDQTWRHYGRGLANVAQLYTYCPLSCTTVLETLLSAVHNRD